MLRNEVDEFRNNFFDKLIKEEREKERSLKLAQSKCPHKYDVEGFINENGYQQRTCSKCGHSTIKNIRVWRGTKHGKCSVQ
jgi:hypothetical protein